MHDIIFYSSIVLAVVATSYTLLHLLTVRKILKLLDKHGPLTGYNMLKHSSILSRGSVYAQLGRLERLGRIERVYREGSNQRHYRIRYEKDV